MASFKDNRTSQTQAPHSQGKNACAGLVAASVLALASTAAAQVITPTAGTAKLYEWDCPLSGQIVTPQNADPRPGALLIGPDGRPWYVTTLGSNAPGARHAAQPDRPDAGARDVQLVGF